MNHKDKLLEEELEKLRDKIQAKRVFWVLPKGNLPAGGLPIIEVQRIINVIAALHGDTVITITRAQSDGIHPSWAGYKQIAKEVR